jgi:hypothetical protein
VESKGHIERKISATDWTSEADKCLGKTYDGLVLVKRSHSLSTSGTTGTRVTGTSRPDGFQDLFVSSYVGSTNQVAESGVAPQGDGLHGRTVGDIVLGGRLTLSDGRPSDTWSGTVTSGFCRPIVVDRSLETPDVAISSGSNRFSSLIFESHTGSSINTAAVNGSSNTEKSRNVTITDPHALPLSKFTRFGHDGVLSGDYANNAASNAHTQFTAATIAPAATKGISSWRQLSPGGSPIIGFTCGTISAGLWLDAASGTGEVEVTIMGYSGDAPAEELFWTEVRATTTNTFFHFVSPFTAKGSNARCYSAFTIRVKNTHTANVVAYSGMDLKVVGSPINTSVDTKIISLEGVGTVDKSAIKFSQDEYVLTRSGFANSPDDHSLSDLLDSLKI